MTLNIVTLIRFYYHQLMKLSKRDYLIVHYWVRKNLGKADYCCFNLEHKGKRYDWANISGLYKEDLADYIPLCRSCHMKFDGHHIKVSKRSKNNKYRAVKINKLDLSNNLIETYNSILEASVKNNLLRTTIINCLQGRTKTAGKVKWEYAIK